MKRALVFALLIVFLTVGVAFAANVVSNGDFSNGTVNWSTPVGSMAVPGSCPDGVANVTSTFPAGFSANQCIRLTSPGTNWTLSANVVTLDSNDVFGIVATFFTGSSCGLLTLDSFSIDAVASPGTTSTNFVYDTAANGANSVRVQFGLLDVIPPITVDSCLDDITLSADGATVVTLTDATAESPAPSPYILLLAIALVLLTGTVVWRRRVALR